MTRHLTPLRLLIVAIILVDALACERYSIYGHLIR